ncbi:hypothetical protein GCM10009836_00630 [Pseudonocardia ailaonensis]|uniref:HTH tetR-type domain-containing protein n=1 Tax=Pseudonocardia ailaonensis TaxID=367279 RepID=A0ABN2MGZ7_9PSEU
MTGLREERTRQTQELILAAAEELFAERGFQSTSLVDVAERSGVSRGSIPWHFGDKQGLLIAVVEKLHADFRRAMDVPIPAGPDGLGQIVRLASTSIRTGTTRLFLTLLQEAGRPGSPVHAPFAAIHQDMRDYFRAWAEQPEVAASLPDGVGPDDIAAIFVGAIIGMNQQYVINPVLDLRHGYEALARIVLER